MATSYDDVVYPSYPYEQSQPDRLATVARLFGLRAPDPRTSRVLELGCAAGGNLLPLAELYPDAQFLGIDLSPRQIEIGQAAARAVGLPNAELRVASITDVTPEWGRFDYILCHGVYSWVPDEVQDAILAICRENLSPDGVAYISYNTYPGWHMRGMIREIMCFHAARFTQPDEQVREARMLLDFLAEACAGENSPHALLLRQETDLIRRQTDAYLYHDHLEENNSPCYLFEFAQKARAAGLQYLGDAVVASMFPRGYAPKIMARLNQLARDVIQMEQYLDFVRNRMFRASLVCHAAVPLVRTIDVDLIQDLHLSTSAARDAAPGEGRAGDASPADERAKDAPPAAEGGKDGEGREPPGVRFKLDTGGVITVAGPVMAPALDALARAWPESVPFDALAGELAAAGVIAATPEGRHQLAAALMHLLVNAVVSASVSPVTCARQVTGAPKVSPLARYLAAKEAWVPTRRHAVFRLDELSRRLVPLLNGQRTRDDLVAVLLQEFRAGKLTLKQDGGPVRDPNRAKEIIAAAVGQGLELLQRGGLLVG